MSEESYIFSSAPAEADIDDYSSNYINGIKKTEESNARIFIDQLTGSPSAAPSDSLDDLMAGSYQSGADSRADYDPLGSARQKAYGGTPEQATRSMASTVIRNAADIPLSVGHGANQALIEAGETINELGDWLEEKIPLGGIAVEWPDGDILPSLSYYKGERPQDSPPALEQIPNIFQEPDTPTGDVTSKIAQFLTGFAVGGQALKGVKATSKIGQFAKASAQGAVSDFAFFDAQEERLSNLIQEVPELQNPVNEFLAASPDDSRAMGRLKNTIEGLGLGAAAEGVMRAIGASLKAVKSFRAERAARVAEQESGNLRAAIADEASPPLEILGRVDSPLIEEASVNASAKALPEGGMDAVDETALTVKSLIGSKAGRTPDDHFYINFARIDTPDDVKEAMQFMADRYRDDLNAARRGEKMSFKQIELNSEQEDAWKILSERRVGQPLNAEQSLAARNLWVSSGEKLTEAARLVAQAPTTENQFAFMKMINVHNTIQKEVIAARTETARALASWRITSSAPKELQLLQMDEILGSVRGGSKTVQELATDVAKLSDAGLVRELETFIEKSPMAIARESVQEYWVMSLLSGPKTHIVNMMSNTMVGLQQVYERAVAARIGKALGDETGVQVGEGMALLNGQIGSIKDAFRLAGKAFKENHGGGYSGKIDLPPTPAISSENWGLARDTAFGKTVDVIGQVVRMPGRALMAEDEFFKTIGYRSELHAQAYREATREAAAGRITHDRIGVRIAEILENPPDNLKIAAVDHAAYSTFTNAPGRFAQGWLRLSRDVPALRFLTPFIKTPANIFNYTVAQRSPFAPLFRSFREDIAAGGARQQLALARVSTSTAIMLAAADLAFSGNITGAGPPSQAERQTMMRGGWLPYSVKIGDQRFSYSRTDPLGMTFGVAADLAEIVNHIDHEDREVDADEAAAYFAASIAGNIMSKSYMSGLSDMMEAMANPKTAAEGYVSRFAGGFVPTLSAEAAKFNDPYMLEINSMIDAMKARIPGLSKDLPARRDLWGRAISYRSGMGSFYDAISPIASRRENPEPIDREMLRLEAYVAAPSKRVSFDGVTVDLTRFGEAYSRYAQLAGNEVKHPAWGRGCMDYLNEMVEGKGALSGVYKMYSDGPEGGKADFIRATINEYRRYARAQLLHEYPKLRFYIEEKRAERPGRFNF